MANGRTVLNGVNWPDGTVTPVPGMYLGVKDENTLQFYTLPAGPGPIIGENGITVTGGTATTNIGLGDIIPSSVSTNKITLNGALEFTGTASSILGEFSNPITSLRTFFVTNDADSQTVVAVRPSGTSNVSGLEVENNSTGINCAGTVLFVTSLTAGIQTYSRGTGKNVPFYIVTGVGGVGGSGSASFLQDVLGNVSIGGNDPLETNATSKFLYISSMLGTPTASPSIPIGNSGPQKGKVPITVDTANNKIYFRAGGMWRNTNTPDYQEFTATADQTVFDTLIRTVAKAGTKSFLQIFVNGIFQQEGATKEYTVTGPAQITFNSGIAADADVVMYGFA